MTNAPEQTGPLMDYQGQPYSRESAARALADFDADEALVKSALSGDIDAQQVRAAYREMARGRQPGALPTMPLDAGAVAEQMGEREAAIHEAQVDTWAGHIHPNEEARGQMKHGLATRQQKQHARDMIRESKADPEFGRKVVTPGIGAKEKEMWAAWNYVAHRCREVPDDYEWSKHAAT